MREPFLTRLEASLGDRIKRRAEVFGSNSDVLRLIVRVFFKLEDAGIIRTEPTWLQEVLQANEENLRNRVASAAREPVAATDRIVGDLTLPSQRKSLIQPRARAAKGATAYKYTSIPPLNFAAFAGGFAGARP